MPLFRSQCVSFLTEIDRAGSSETSPSPWTPPRGLSVAGSPPRDAAVGLTPGQFRLIPDFLWHGAESYGFRGEVWTCERVVGVNLEEFGVSYSKSQVSRLLNRLGWTPQAPITRAIQRDEEAIKRCESSRGPS